MYTVIPRRSTKQATKNNSFENQQGNSKSTLENICFTHQVAVKEEENKKVTLRKQIGDDSLNAAVTIIIVNVNGLKMNGKNKLERI